jgi:hypothetical protein
MRALVALSLFFSFLFSANFIHPDFSNCYKKNRTTFTYQEDLEAYPYNSKYAIVYAPHEKLQDFIKYDKFLGLYLVANSSGRTLKFKSTDSVVLGEWMGSADESSLYVGNFAKKMDGLDAFAKMASSNEPNAVVMCLCCEIYGIAIGLGDFIESEYIHNFVTKKEDTYGSFGVRFDKVGKKIVVKTIDPFCKNRSLELGDEILSIDGKAISELWRLKREILFGTPMDKRTLKIKRDGKAQKIVATLSQRYGGGVLSDTFLERYGLYFDKSLILLGAQSFKLKVGDRLIEVDGKKVSSFDDVRQILSTANKRARLLFSRDKFEFFVEIDESNTIESTKLNAENNGI